MTKWVLLLTLAGCGTEVERPPYRQPTGAVCPPGSTLRYDDFGRTLATAYCTLCHSSTLSGAERRSAPVGLDFDTAEGIRSAAATIDRVAAIGPLNANRDMPAGKPAPTDAERAQLAEWLACGAP